MFSKLKWGLHPQSEREELSSRILGQLATISAVGLSGSKTILAEGVRSITACASSVAEGEKP